MADRHPSVAEKMDWFEYQHLKPSLQAISEPCAELAETMVAGIPDHPQLALGLQRLIEAKDCFVRAALAAERAAADE